MRVEVAAALVFRNGRFLIGQRPPEKARGGLWEFVGGKKEPGESLPEALVRECREELDAPVRVGKIFCEVEHAYEDITVHLTLFHTELDGEAVQKEHTALRWITPEEIPDFAFCPADVEILEKIQKEYGAPASVGAIRRHLLTLRDASYQVFQSRLLPDLDDSLVIGVRTPLLRSYAREIFKNGQAEAFLQALPHVYFEENNLHAFLLEKERDFARALSQVDAFLPYVDNWATCDQMNPRVFRRNLPVLHQKAVEWIGSLHPYTVRYGIGVLMRYFLEDAFSYDDFALAASAQGDAYYVNMMIAWYFATALAKRPEETRAFLAEDRLSDWVRRKTVQKACESRRISDAQKEELRAWLKGRNDG